MDKTEQFVLQERDGDRRHRTLRIGLFLAAVVVVSTVFSIRSCSLAHAEAQRVVESEEVRQAGETERLKLAHYARCLKVTPRTECVRAYYPFRQDAPTPEQRHALEALRAEQAHRLYVHCTTRSHVHDKDCDDEVQKIMKTVKGAP